MTTPSSPPPDYTTYSHAALLQRVTDLETQLRLLSSSPLPANTTTLTINAKKLKPRKPPKPFDPIRYHTRLIALKFAYLGSAYNGFEHHTNNTTPLPTVEGELWKALMKTKLIFPTFAEGQSEEEVCWEGCEYSKCGRTDRGVSAFGQVVGVRVRSAKRRRKVEMVKGSGDGVVGEGVVDGFEEKLRSMEVDDAPDFDPIRDEIPYIQTLNRVLPPDIRILSWCPNPPPDFSARFNCRERRYRYFFTNPAFVPPYERHRDQTKASGSPSEGWLDIKPMDAAAKKLEGLHDFRNFCKVDPGKQITDFHRRIFSAGVYEAGATDHPKDIVADFSKGMDRTTPQLLYFEVRGSAFLWHQVRHMIAILFLVGQGYETPEVVDHLFDTERCPGKPTYEMAVDTPLVLWDCIFPTAAQLEGQDHGSTHPADSHPGYVDALDWVYVGDEAGGCDISKSAISERDGKWGRKGIMDDLWSLWRKRKIDEILAGKLMDLVALQGQARVEGQVPSPVTNGLVKESDRIFDGSDRARTVGTYIPLMKREQMEPPDVVNARYAARKGVYVGRSVREIPQDADE